MLTFKYLSRIHRHHGRMMYQKKSREGRSLLAKCCGALDGLAVKVCESTASEVSNDSTYYKRKGFLL